jgi:hypothetical protein
MGTPFMIKLGIDYECESGIIFDKKSYVLKRSDGKLILKGNTVKSRKMEPFCLAFVRTCIDHILQDPKDYPWMCFMEFKSLMKRVKLGKLEVSDIAQRGMLNMELDDYVQRVAAGQTNMSAMYEAALQSDKKLRKGDVVYFYIADPGNEWVTIRGKDVYRKAKRKAAEKARLITDFRQDYDIDHYVKRLEQAAKRFLVIENFDSMFGVKLTAADRKKLENINHEEEEDYES